MLASFVDLLAERRRARAGLGAFTCYDLESAAGVLAAAEAQGRGVVLLVASAAFAAPGGVELLAALRVAASRSSVPACVQLDHVSDRELIERAFDAGAGAVMADGSRLPLAENASLVADAVALARRGGGAVEAELGHVSGDEDVASAAAAGQLTDPDVVEDFVTRTRAACLAVSIGNAHGLYTRAPALDWPRLAAIRAATGVALSLHGASGLGEAMLRRAIAAGITKVNVNTELREAYLDATAAALEDARDGQRVLHLHREQSAAVGAVAAAKLAQYEPEG
jgi:tagatose 1,6-diphosphate aldolase GatY/KbaY